METALGRFRALLQFNESGALSGLTCDPAFDLSTEIARLQAAGEVPDPRRRQPPSVPQSLLECLRQWGELGPGVYWLFLEVEPAPPQHPELDEQQPKLWVSDVLKHLSTKWFVDFGGQPPEPRPAPVPEPEERRLAQELAVRDLAISLGEELHALIDAQRASPLLQKIPLVRRKLAQELGIVLPGVQIRDDRKAGKRAYRILLRESCVGGGEVRPGQLLAVGPDRVLRALRGALTTHPAYGLPAAWISPEEPQPLQEGYVTLTPEEVVAGHLMEVARRYAHHFLTTPHVRSLLRRVEKGSPDLWAELRETQVPLRVFRVVLRELMREQVPLHDLEAILETLLDHYPRQTDPVQLSETVRARLGGMICGRLLDGRGVLKAVSIPADLDADDDAAGRQLAGLADAMKQQGLRRIVLAAPEQRRRVARLSRSQQLNFQVLSRSEIPEWIQVELARLAEGC